MAKINNDKNTPESEKEQETEEASPESKIKHKEIIIRHHHDGGNIVWGILFIFLGATFLLNNIGIIPWSIWDSLIHYWPLLLVLGGIQIILGGGAGADLVMLVITLVIFVSVWTKALIDINSPLVITWGLSKIPWFNFLQNLNIRI